MNDFAERFSGDELFKRVCIGVAIGASVFTLYVML